VRRAGANNIIGVLGLATACLSLHAYAGDVSFAGVLPNGAQYSTNVTSMRDLHFTNIVRQHTDYSCGAAALATLLRYGYHLDVDETVVIDGMLGVSDPDIVKKRGFSMLDIKHYVESLGMRGRGYRVDMARLRSLRVPVIVLMDIRGYRHFVVLKQVHNDQVELADPILGNRTMQLDAFMKAWPSHVLFVVIGSDFDRNTVCFNRSTNPVHGISSLAKVAPSQTPNYWISASPMPICSEGLVMYKRSLIFTALALGIMCRCAPVLANDEPNDSHLGAGIHDVTDPELADMRGRYVVGDNAVVYFGVEMIPRSNPTPDKRCKAR
jgi:predicted double-glycine peptidase